MSINELQNLVVGALHDDEEEITDTRRGAEIFFAGTRNGISFDGFISDAQDTADNVFQLSGDEILYRVASLAARSQLLSPRIYSFPTNSLNLLYRAIDFKESGEKENLLEIQNLLREMVASHQKEDRSTKIRHAVSSKEMVLDILEAVWGEKTEENLLEISGVKKATVKRWMAGANIGSSTYGKLTHLAKIFYVLREEKGYDRKDLLDWYNTPLGDGKTPRESFVAVGWGAPANVREFMNELDLSIY